MSIVRPSGSDDRAIDVILRPTSWEDYIGQNTIKQNLQVILTAAKNRREAVDHLLFYGQAGLGKTTLAHLVAKEMGTNMKITSGPSLERTGDLAAVLSTLEAGDVLFIDEAHRTPRAIEEMLYSAMESQKLHVVTGKGLGARMLTFDLPPFTIIAATTRLNMLSSPLRSRFGAIFKLDYYKNEDIEEIISRAARVVGVEIDSEAVVCLAGASRFTPRIANRLMKRARDVAEVKGDGVITEGVAKNTLLLFEIDDKGLEIPERRLLEALINKFNNRPTGLRALAAACGEEEATIEEVYEPYLIRLGLIHRTPSGRMCTDEARKHLNNF